MQPQESQARPPLPRPMSRRRALELAGAALAAVPVGGLLAACGGSAPSTTQATAGASSSTSTNASSTAASGSVTRKKTTAASPSSSGGQAPQAGGELIYALTNKIDTLDPNITTSTDVVRMAFHLFDPLAWQPEAGKFIPGLAQKWEVTSAADQYTFHLRTDVKFHDGTPFNADAVKFTFDRIVDPSLKSQIAFSLIGPYDSTTVSDPATAVVKFKTPYAPFLDSVSQPMLGPVSPDAVKKLGQGFNTQPVGTGPFKFDKYQTDVSVRMVKNPDYNWGPSMFRHQGPPYLDAITWRIIPEPATRLAALQSGEVHFIQDVPTQNYAGLKSDSKLGLMESVAAGSPWMMMINVTNPPGDDVKVRQALEWGVDKVGMIKSVWQGLYKPAYSPLTANLFGYDPKTADVYKYDPKKAGDLLDEAGWKMGSGGVRQKDGQDLVLGMYYRSDNSDFTGMATFLQSMYQPLGIKIDLQGLAQAGYFDAVRAGKHHLQFWQESGTDPDMVRIYFYSSNADGGTNRSRYKNAEMDKLIDDAAGTTDPDKRKQLYSQIQMKALNEAIMVYFADPVNVFAYQKSKVQNPMLLWSGVYPLFYETSLSKT